MRYLHQEKEWYLNLCRRYNRAEKTATTESGGFVMASLRLHAAKGNVPQSWRTAAFVRSIGTEAD